MFEFATIAQLALGARDADVETQRQNLKKIQIEVNNLVHAFRNGGAPEMSQEEEDVRAVVALLGQRHPGTGIVWEKPKIRQATTCSGEEQERKRANVIRVSHYGVILPEWLFRPFPKNYTGGIETDAERRLRIVKYIENQLKMRVIP